jgi:hypothetical protein
MISLYSVSSDVKNVINKINIWLKTESNTHSKLIKHLTWPLHCDGGTNSQLILDFFIKKKSLERIINLEKFNELIIIGESDTIWEKKLLISVAKKNNINVNIYNKYKLKKNIRVIKNKFRSIISLCLKIYRIIKIKFEIKFNKPEVKFNTKYKIGIQLVGESANHNNHTLELTTQIKKQEMEPIVLGWLTGESIKLYKKEKIKFVKLEGYIKLREIFFLLYYINYSILKVKKIINNLKIETSDVLEEIIRNLIIKNYTKEVFLRAALEIAVKRYLEENKLNAIRPWTLVWHEGVELYYQYKEKNKNGLVFEQGGWPYNLRNPITEVNSDIKREEIFYFACSTKQVEYLIKKGYKKKNIFKSGMHWINSINEFGEQNNKKQSRENLNLKANYIILLDVNANVSGYQSKSEQIQVLECLIQFLNENKEYHLLVKEHPASNDSDYKFLINKSKLKNITIINKNILPYESINASDIVITKMSTLALEAMYLNVPVLGVILDNEPEWEVYGESLEYCRTISQLKLKLNEIFTNEEKFDEWKNIMKKKKEEFFIEHDIVNNKNSSDLVAREIKNSLKFKTNL